MDIKKSIVKVFSANFLQLISGIIVGFFVPAILTIDGYANLKTYTLFLSYVGLLHFGYLDGLYIKYGGKRYQDIDKGTLKGEYRYTMLLEFIITLILFIIGIVKQNIVVVLFAITIIPANICTFFKGIFQATGEFSHYTKIIKTYTVLYTIFNILLVLVVKSQQYIYYCLTILISHFITYIILEVKFRKKYKDSKTQYPNDVKNVIGTGMLVLLGNLSVVALFGIDKWFVKWFLTTEDFAYYSFAVSMLNIINTLVNAISITFYNYLFTNNCKENIAKLKDYLITLGGLASAGYFALKFIVEIFIKKYVPSLDIIAITFAIFPYMILINALYVNLYKVNKNEKKYFKVVLSMLIISIIYNIIAVIIFKNSISIAYATVLTLITWVIYSTYDLENVKYNKKNVIYLLIITITFLITSHYFKWWIGMICYLSLFTVATLILNKKVIKDLIEMAKKILKIS